MRYVHRIQPLSQCDCFEDLPWWPSLTGHAHGKLETNQLEHSPLGANAFDAFDAKGYEYRFTSKRASLIFYRRPPSNEKDAN